MNNTTIRVALVGNPNSGKSTLFNNITGAHQRVGNYPGVTVEWYSGKRQYKDTLFELVDLPGTYSLSAYSDEERVTRNVLTQEQCDLVINVVDASNLERNLFLTLQLKELGIPVLVVLNMIDVAKKNGVTVDINKLSRLLGTSVVESVGYDPSTVSVVLEASQKLYNNPDTGNGLIAYNPDLESILERFAEKLYAKSDCQSSVSSKRWTALKLLEQDDIVLKAWDCEQTQTLIKEAENEIQQRFSTAAPTAIATARFDTISQMCVSCVRSKISTGPTVSDKVDAVLTNRWLGIPIFLLLMYLVFQLTFTIGAYPMEWIESGFSLLSDWISSFWADGEESLLKSLLLDGIIGGVGGVIVFLPNILLLFLAISILEDSGYMARAAYLTDRYMHALGLHGKSFIPMLIGFGCSVPAIMATRTLSSRKERLITMFIVPLMSCGARLPIYALLIPAFFSQPWQAPVMWGIYCLGIVVAIILAKIMSLFVIRDEDAPFIIELPPYRVPTFRTVGIHTLERGWLYLRKAGTVILGISIVLWTLTTFPTQSPETKAQFEAQRTAVEQNQSLSDEIKAQQIAQIDNLEAEKRLVDSYVGKIGHAIEPILKPMGFDWKIGTALIGAVAAKEVFVAQMGIIYSVGEADEESQPLRDVIAQTYSPLVGLGLMVFCLLASPCMATFAIMARESGAWKWAFAQWTTLTVIGWIAATLVYQVGMWLQF